MHLLFARFPARAVTEFQRKRLLHAVCDVAEWWRVSKSSGSKGQGSSSSAASVSQRLTTITTLHALLRAMARAPSSVPASAAVANSPALSDAQLEASEAAEQKLFAALTSSTAASSSLDIPALCRSLLRSLPFLPLKRPQSVGGGKEVCVSIRLSVSVLRGSFNCAL
jgi:hypothetical protein